MTKLHLKVILFNLFLVLSIIFLFLKSEGIKGKKRIGINLAIALCFLLLLIQYAVYIDAQYVEPNWIKIEKVKIVNNKFPIELSNLKIVQISDPHVKRLGFREYSLIKKIRGIDPDIILITGDFLTERKYFSTLLSVLKKLKAKIGVFGVIGDNDQYAINADLFKTVLESIGVHILDNANVRIPINDKEGIWLIGLTSETIDRKAFEAAYAGVDLSEPKILLTHYPKVADSELINVKNVDLVLSGGTHGGQIGLPFGKLFYNPNQLKYISGLYYVKDVPLYVNRGIGTIGNIHVGDTEGDTVRFFCRPEVTIIRLSNNSS